MRFLELFLKGMIAGAASTGKFIAAALIFVLAAKAFSFFGVPAGATATSPKLADATVMDLLGPIFLMAVFLGIWLKD